MKWSAVAGVWIDSPPQPGRSGLADRGTMTQTSLCRGGPLCLGGGSGCFCVCVRCWLCLCVWLCGLGCGRVYSGAGVGPVLGLCFFSCGVLGLLCRFRGGLSIWQDTWEFLGCGFLLKVRGMDLLRTGLASLEWLV